MASAGRPLVDTRFAPKVSQVLVMRWIAGALLLLLVASCSVLACRPLTIVVVQKEEGVRLESMPQGIRTTETGRLEEGRRTEIVRDHWVRGEDGTWYPVTDNRYRAAAVGRPLELCR